MADITRLDSFAFDSSDDGYDADGYPVYDRAVGASILRAVFSNFFSDGVLGSDSDALKISKGESGLLVTVNPGMFIIRGAMGGIDGDPLSVKLTESAPQGNVAYGVMLRYDENINEVGGEDVGRSLSIRVVAGAASSSPQPPAPDQSTPGVMEYRLGYVTVPSGATDLSGATVTNEKGTRVCPYAAPFEEIDMSAVVTDAKDRAQEVTDAFLLYAKQYYDVVAGALDGTEVQKLMDMIDNINAYSFVDNETTQVNASGKIEVKDNGIGGVKIKNYAISQNHLDNFLRQKLGLLDPSSWDYSQYKDYVGPLGGDDQTSFIKGNMTSGSVAGWTADQMVEFDGVLKTSAAHSAFGAVIDPDAWGWADLSTIGYGVDASALSKLVGKTKTDEFGKYGRKTLRIIGVLHDDLADSDGKAAITFRSTQKFFESTLNDGSNMGSGEGWEQSALRASLQEITSQFPSELQPLVKNVKKKSSRSAGSTNPLTNCTVDTTTDKVFILAVYELDSTFNASLSSLDSTRYDASSWPEGAQYEYIKNYNQWPYDGAGQDGEQELTRTVLSLKPVIFDHGKIGMELGYGGTKCPIAPCFCI